MSSFPGSVDNKEIDPAKEAVKKYLEVNREVEILRRKFFDAMRRKRDSNATAYAATLKDYRNIQVKILQTLSHLGVKHSEDDLVRLLSDLPEVKCDVKDCACGYHRSIRAILDSVEEKQDDNCKDNHEGRESSP